MKQSRRRRKHGAEKYTMRQENALWPRKAHAEHELVDEEDFVGAQYQACGLRPLVPAHADAHVASVIDEINLHAVAASAAKRRAQRSASVRVCEWCVQRTKF